MAKVWFRHGDGGCEAITNDAVSSDQLFQIRKYLRGQEEYYE